MLATRGKGASPAFEDSGALKTAGDPRPDKLLRDALHQLPQEMLFKLAVVRKLKPMAERDNFREPGMGEINLGAVAGGVVGSIGGLFAVGIPPAIVFRSLQAVFSTPKLAVICFVIAGAIGLVIGGLIGPRMRRVSANPWAEVAAGVAGGLIPVIVVLAWSYRMVTTY